MYDNIIAICARSDEKLYAYTLDNQNSGWGVLNSDNGNPATRKEVHDMLRKAGKKVARLHFFSESDSSNKCDIDLLINSDYKLIVRPFEKDNGISLDLCLDNKQEKVPLHPILRLPISSNNSDPFSAYFLGAYHAEISEFISKCRNYSVNDSFAGITHPILINPLVTFNKFPELL